MAEKFFIVTEKSQLFKEYSDWIENEKIAREFACDFAKRHSLPNLISYDNTTFSIIVDNRKPNPLKDQLKKVGTWTKGGDLFDFKKNSTVGKAWISELQTANLKIKHRPIVPFYFSGSYGKWGWEMFLYNKKLYLKVETDHEPNVPDGMTEIKGSEYYKAAEDDETQKKAVS